MHIPDFPIEFVSLYLWSPHPMMRRQRAFMATATVVCSFPEPCISFALPTIRAGGVVLPGVGATKLQLAQGFGETPKPAKPDDGKKGPRKARPLMPLADAASKLLPKEGKDGTLQFDNPAVGDFQVLDSLVEVGHS